MAKTLDVTSLTRSTEVTSVYSSQFQHYKQNLESRGWRRLKIQITFYCFYKFILKNNNCNDINDRSPVHPLLLGVGDGREGGEPSIQLSPKGKSRHYYQAPNSQKLLLVQWYRHRHVQGTSVIKRYTFTIILQKKHSSEITMH